MATRSCWHFNRCTPSPTSTKSKHPSSQTEKMCVETEFGSYKALVVHELACGWQRGLVGISTAAHYHFNRCTPPPSSTKSKHPSSQTEKLCVETEFGRYKALVVV
eukprot:scaffold9350_cov135-Skeletonema_dohrnii-CCMP3373.AAC.1